MEVSKMSKNMGLLYGGLALLIVVLFFVIYGAVKNKQSNKIVYSSEASINQIKDIDELLMMHYPYNGIAKRVQMIEKRNGKSEEKLLYKVTYKGWVTIGTKEKPNFEVNNETKTILLHISEPKILDYKVDFDSIDYIFEKRKYETETISADSHKLCIEHMQERIDCDTTLKMRARRNTENTAKSFYSSIYPNYKIICD